MAVSQIELVQGESFTTACEGGAEFEASLPSWFPRGFGQADLEKQIAVHGVEGIMGLIVAQEIIELRARVRMDRRTKRVTKAGEEALEPKARKDIEARLEEIRFSGPGAGVEKKVAKAKKALAGLSPAQLAELLAALRASGEEEGGADA